MKQKCFFFNDRVYQRAERRRLITAYTCSVSCVLCHKVYTLYVHPAGPKSFINHLKVTLYKSLAASQQNSVNLETKPNVYYVHTELTQFFVFFLRIDLVFEELC